MSFRAEHSVALNDIERIDYGKGHERAGCSEL